MANKKYAIKANEQNFIIRYIDKRFLDTAGSWYALENIEELEQQWRHISKIDTPNIQAFMDELPDNLLKNLKASIRANRTRTGSNQGKRISVTLSIKAHMMLQDVAKAQGVTLSQVIENGLKASVKSELEQENKRLKEKLSRLEQTKLPE